LKTAVRHAVAALNGSRPLRDNDVADVAASFQAAVVDVIEDRLRVAMRMFRAALGAPHAVVIAGGVGANGAIRAMLTQFCAQSGLPLVAPPAKLCTDNGAMIAWAGVERLRINQTDSLDAPARPRWPLDPNAGRSLNGKA
jgi:N6-L-threonylcarbamoyladenine synthase